MTGNFKGSFSDSKITPCHALVEHEKKPCLSRSAILKPIIEKMLRQKDVKNRNYFKWEDVDDKLATRLKMILFRRLCLIGIRLVHSWGYFKSYL